MLTHNPTWKPIRASGRTRPQHPPAHPPRPRTCPRPRTPRTPADHMVADDVAGHTHDKDVTEALCMKEGIQEVEWGRELCAGRDRSTRASTVRHCAMGAPGRTRAPAGTANRRSTPPQHGAPARHAAQCACRRHSCSRFAGPARGQEQEFQTGPRAAAAPAAQGGRRARAAGGGGRHFAARRQLAAIAIGLPLHAACLSTGCWGAKHETSNNSFVRRARQFAAVLGACRLEHTPIKRWFPSIKCSRARAAVAFSMPN